MIFLVAIKNSAFLKRLKVSKEKAENVANPPQKPIPISNFTEGEVNPFSSKPNIK